MNQTSLALQQIKKTNPYFSGKMSCSEFIELNGFYSRPITAIEYNYTIAFTILAYKHFYQFQVLLRTLYSRSNFHCIHVDVKAPIIMYKYVVKLSECLENVYLSPVRLTVRWAGFSILEAERSCQLLLLNKEKTWKYYMNLAGTELPLQTNYERANILALGNGLKNDITSYKNTHLYRHAMKLHPPPENVTLWKGEFHVILTRKFVEYLHTSPLAQHLYIYLNGTNVPDEHFYSSLNRRPDFPGYSWKSYSNLRLLSHYKVWIETQRHMCKSQIFGRGELCQFTYKDLTHVMESKRLFVNKFNQNVDLIGIDCIEQWLKVKQYSPNKIRKEDYRQFPFFQQSNMSEVQDKEEEEALAKLTGKI
ncbi:unnamed protein product [Didymodactylos carnosus]|uniref:Uncharacterized protein n=1 Tax=Didymodactylos carnosus TaxID=1234261 RepID=A0A814PT33_9BILA|nr:unnamed protein product [Didymodactylos carnosus]CAF1110146.1 unnamed protein product [Didymodactylos carnosus]CAF3719691.1 unnamed protein product [Didymodactylos carnosus]CAF3874568.1 unnamed protein product [Didymodactylos carnosus]